MVDKQTIIYLYRSRGYNKRAIARELLCIRGKLQRFFLAALQPHMNGYMVWQIGKYSWNIMRVPCFVSRDLYKVRWHSCRCRLRYRNSSKDIFRTTEETLSC